MVNRTLSSVGRVSAILLLAVPSFAFTVEKTGERLNSSVATQVIGAFFKNCPILAHASPDIISVKLEMVDEFADFRLQRGWITNIHLAVKLRDDLAFLPVYDDRTGVIGGHTLHYDIGAGDQPGMLGQKRVSQMLCNMPISDSGDSTFKAVPAFALIKY